jgi:TonB family protein
VSSIVIAFDTAGDPGGTLFARSPLSPAARDSVLGAVQPLLRRQPPRHGTGGAAEQWLMQLDVGGAGTPGVSVGGIEECRPAVKNPRQAMAYLQGEISRARSSGLRLRDGAVSVVVRIRVDTAGAPAEVEIASSGGPEMDRIALVFARHMTFVPASVAGKPVLAWATLPVTFIPSQFGSNRSAQGEQDAWPPPPPHP